MQTIVPAVQVTFSCDHCRHSHAPMEATVTGPTIEACRSQAVTAGWSVGLDGAPDHCYLCKRLMEAANKSAGETT